MCFWQHQHRDEGYIQWQWQTAASKARKSQISALRLLVLSLMAGHAVQTAVRRANHGLNFARRPSALARRGQTLGRALARRGQAKGRGGLFLGPFPTLSSLRSVATLHRRRWRRRGGSSNYSCSASHLSLILRRERRCFDIFLVNSVILVFWVGNFFAWIFFHGKVFNDCFAFYQILIAFYVCFERVWANPYLDKKDIHAKKSLILNTKVLWAKKCR